MERIEEIVKKNAERMGLIPLEVNIRNGEIGAVIFKNGGNLNVEDLEELSRYIQKDLSILGLDGVYGINLYSPGLDRVLKSRFELDLFAGSNVKFSYEKDDKVVTDTGKLIGNVNNQVQFERNGEVINIPFEKLRKVSLFTDEFSKQKKRGHSKK